MGFNPLNIFNEKSKQMPIRGPGGKFVSTKPKSKEEIKEKKTEVTETKGGASKGPLITTFYGHEIRRYYKDKAWYFSLDDISHVAYLNSDDPTVRKGDMEKLSEAKEKYAIKIDGVEAAKPSDIIKFISYFKGNMPGPITIWLSQSTDYPVPKESETNKEPAVIRSPSPINPSDTGR